MIQQRPEQGKCVTKIYVYFVMLQLIHSSFYLAAMGRIKISRSQPLLDEKSKNAMNSNQYILPKGSARTSQTPNKLGEMKQTTVKERQKRPWGMAL